MTPQEKSKELNNKFVIAFTDDDSEYYSLDVKRMSKKCALIAVDEILKIECLLGGEKYPNDLYFKTTNHLEFWNEVKAEINLL